MFHYVDGIVDMMEKFKLHELPHGINATAGACGARRFPYQNLPEVAYSINEEAMITIATADVIKFQYSIASEYSLKSLIFRHSPPPFQPTSL
jgi:hypothetical protein